MCAGAGLLEMINYKELYLTRGWRPEQVAVQSPESPRR